MPLDNGYIDLPPGKLANIQTCLEMHSKPPLRRQAQRQEYVLRRIGDPGAEWYRNLFRAIGEPYLWSSRLLMDDAELLAIIRDPLVEIYALELKGADAGLLELDFRVRNECELVFFGLKGDAVGRGAGRWMMNRAIELAWAHPIERFWVHTCNLDHPSALPFYVRSGFVPFKRQIEIMDDPRLIGVLAKSAAPDVPLI